jgi:hypothetical protein
MASAYYSDVRGVKAKKGKGAPTGAEGTAPAPGKIKEKTVAWPTVGPTWGTSFNRKTKVPVVKQYAKKYGVD